MVKVVIRGDWKNAEKYRVIAMDWNGVFYLETHKRVRKILTESQYGRLIHGEAVFSNFVIYELETSAYIERHCMGDDL